MRTRKRYHKGWGGGVIGAATTVLLLTLAAGCQPPRPLARPTSVTPASKARTDASDAFFQRGTIPQLRIQLNADQAQKLREDARRYVQATLIENDQTTFESVAVKLKGAAGSFRELDDKPAFTLNMGKFRAGQVFHDLEKWHLNNSVQDETYLCELVCSRLCASAGVPTPRVTHARVWLDDRDLGLYVLKEGFDKRFLARHFAHPDGNLYDGGFLLDIDAELEKDSGTGVDDRRDLHQLVEACRESDPDMRWKRVAERLDVEKFLTFMAIELMTCHWDGYTCSRNNYRVYFDPATGKAHFFPHGMDQMFGDPGFPLFNQQEPMVAATVWQNPEWRQRLRTRVTELAPLFEPDKLNPLVDEVAARLGPVLREISPEAVQHHQQLVAEFKERLAARAGQIHEQLNQPDPTPLEFDGQQPIELDDWYPAQETENARIEEVEVDGRMQRTIAAGPGGRCVASWRRKVLLAHGRYRFEARARTQGVAPLEEEQGTGAGIRISGGQRTNKVVEDSDWQEIAFEFEVLEPAREVELVAELRAERGQVWFDTPLTLRRLAGE